MTLFLIYFGSIFCALVLAQEPQKVPTIQDELFSFPQNGLNPPRIPLEYVRGVPTLKFSIGTPKQEFVGIFDTSSPVSWVMSANCTSSACAAVSDNEKFRSQDSSTNYQFPFRVDLTYIDGTHVQLKPELDVMQFADYPFPPHLVAEALQVDYPKGYLPPANARLGMGGFGDIDWTKAAANVDPAVEAPTAGAPVAGAPAADAPTAGAPAAGGLRRATGDDRFSTGATSSPSFRKRGPMGAAITAFAWIFGVDESLYTGPIYQLPIAPISGLSSPFWNIPLSGFRFNTSQTTSQNQPLRFQLQSDAYGKIYSSSPALIVPKALADDMNKAIGAVYNGTLNLYTIACSAYDTAPSLVFEFGAGTDAEIPPQQYIYKLEDDEQSAYANQGGCYTAISGGGDDKNVYLGGPFFRSFYLTYQFSAKAVGIAESIAKIGKVYPHASSQ